MSKKKSELTLSPVLRHSTVEIDGETYSLAFTFRAIATAEKLAGVNLLQGLNGLTDLNAGQFHGLLFAALMPAHPKITSEQVDAMIRLDTIAKLQLALAEAYVNSMPKRDEANPPQPVAEQLPASS